MLFLELALIRWIGANDAYVEFLANLVLLASFLGIGIGFLRVGRDPQLLPWAPVFLAVLIAFFTVYVVSSTMWGGRWYGRKRGAQSR